LKKKKGANGAIRLSYRDDLTSDNKSGHFSPFSPVAVGK